MQTERNHLGVKFNAADLTVMSSWGVKGTGWDGQRSPLALCVTITQHLQLCVQLMRLQKELWELFSCSQKSKLSP